MTRRLVVLAFWVAGIAFPMAWFTRFSDTFDRAFTTLFTPVWSHVVMHAFLFAVLAWLLTRILPSQPLAVVLGLVMLVALLQEGVQLLYTGQTPGADEAFDLLVDFGGGVMGAALGKWWRARTAER
ncbi:MAG: hypothetical protein N2383_04555 [Caldilineales bacterium]|nr:hypothetical protein [Caldilineales bacterium]